MKPIKLKDIINETYRVQEGARQRGDFSATVDIDIAKLDKGTLPGIDTSTPWIEPDVDVEVEVDGSYDDASFDYEYGSVRGTHDPGSGYVIDDMTIFVADDVRENGEPDGKIIIPAGTVIPEKAIVNLDSLNDQATEYLNNKYSPDYDEPDYDPD